MSGILFESQCTVQCQIATHIFTNQQPASNKVIESVVHAINIHAYVFIHMYNGKN